MSSQPSPSAWDGRCVICHVNVGDDVRLPYCPDHLAEREERRRVGVDEDQRDRRWGDTLALWRGRPAWLDDEEDVALFRFRQRLGTWLLFTRGYQGRLPDWIAVDATTGKVTRLVECGVPEALDHFRQVRPASGQEMLSSRWGVPEPRSSRRMSLSDSVASAEFPVYGLEQQPLGLVLRSTSHSLAGCRTTGITLLFAGPGAGTAEAVVVRLRSYIYHRGVVLPQDDDKQPLIEEVTRVLREGSPRSLATKAALGAPIRIDRRIRIPQFSGPVRLYRFLGSENIFHLSSGGGVPHPGFTFVVCGFSQAGLSGLMENLAVINGRKDLLQTYETELGAR